MIAIIINSVNHKIELTNEITIIQIENTQIYRNLSLNLDENIKIIVDDEEKTLNTISSVIYNPYQININDKKIINLLYKKLEIYSKKVMLERIHNIEENALSLLEELSCQFDFSLNYNENIDINKLFSAFNLSFQSVDNENYLEVLLSFIKINIELVNSKVFICFGLTNLFTEEELAILRNELFHLNVKLLDIVFVNKNKNHSIIIDEDCCII